MYLSERHDIHTAFHEARRNASFFPNSLFLFLDFPEVELWGSRPASRTLWHEYMHFLQVTTTSYGMNVFLRELELAKLTFQCLHELRQVCGTLALPLLRWRSELANGPIRQLLDQYIAIKKYIEQDLATLQGACFLDARSQQVVYKGEPVLNQAGCPFVDYHQDPSRPSPVPVGARAIMECAASALEFLYLCILGSASNGDPEIDAMAKEWTRTKEADPAYYVTIDMASQYFRGEDFGRLTKLLAVSDLALSPPLELRPSPYEDDTQRYPGRRFLAAMSAATQLPTVEPLDFHDQYSELITALCHSLGWPLPWQEMADQVIGFVHDNMLATKNDVLCDLLGPALVFLTGATLRRKYPNYCANPIPNLSEALRIAKQRSKPAIVHWEMVFAAHPMPFVRLRDGSRVFSDLAAEAMAGQIAMSPKELEKEASQSFENYYFVQRVVDTIWTGSDVTRKGVRCLQCDRIDQAACAGLFATPCGAAPADCICRNYFERLTGFAPEEARWIRTNC